MLHPVDDLRWARCDIKAIDLLAAVLAKDEARSAGAHEALFVAPDGTVREGGSSNVFAVVGGVLRTHPADNHILDGITRRHVLQLAREAGLPGGGAGLHPGRDHLRRERRLRGLHRLHPQGHHAGGAGG